MADKSDKTTAPPSRVAVGAFMGVAELVENMLLSLPLNEILLAQRVCHTWKNVIENSPTIQRALFFRPCTSFKLSLVESRGVYGLDCRNNKKCWRRNPTGSVVHAGAVRWARETGETTEYRILVNPFIGVNGPDWDCYIGRHGKIWKSEAFRREEASWRKMLFTQPPISAALVHHGQRNHWHTLKATNETRGITMQDVVSNAGKFTRNVWTIWGEDGIAKLPVPQGEEDPARSTGADIIAEMAREPAEDEDDVIIW